MSVLPTLELFGGDLSHFQPFAEKAEQPLYLGLNSPSLFMVLRLIGFVKLLGQRMQFLSRHFDILAQSTRVVRVAHLFGGFVNGVHGARAELFAADEQDRRQAKRIDLRIG